MSSYSEILDKLSKVKVNEQYVGFNPLSTKKVKGDNVYLVCWLIVLIVISCLVAVMFTWVFNSKETAAVGLNVNSSSIVIDNQKSKNTAVMLEQKIIQEKNKVELLLNKQISINTLSKIDFPNKNSKNEVAKNNLNGMMEIDRIVKIKNKAVSINVKNKPVTIIDSKKINFFIKSNDSVNVGTKQSIKNTENSITNHAPVYHVDQLLGMVKNSQFEKALEFSKYLNNTQKMIIQAKVYEQTDVKKSIDLYQKLILSPDSPIDYVLKLAILNEKNGNFNQSLYYYQLFNRHNTGTNQDVVLFVNKKISKLNSNRGEI